MNPCLYPEKEYPKKTHPNQETPSLGCALSVPTMLMTTDGRHFPATSPIGESAPQSSALISLHRPYRHSRAHWQHYDTLMWYRGITFSPLLPCLACSPHSPRRHPWPGALITSTDRRAPTRVLLCLGWSISCLHSCMCVELNLPCFRVRGRYAAGMAG